MKKILIFIIGFILLSSCTEKDRNRMKENSKYHNEQLDTTRTYRAANIDKFIFEGHRYIMFSGNSGYSGYAGVVHDPDCPCFYKRDSV